MKKVGFELIESRVNKTIEDIKKAVMEYISLGMDAENIKLSSFITKHIPYDYSYLSDLFSSIEGKTIEQFFILQRIEKVKELLVYDQLSLTEISYQTGFLNVWVGVGNIQQCMLFFTVVNAPASGPTVDPGPAFGTTGVVNFTYRGQPVAYTTVRAKDGKIWLQQNLGSPQVAFHTNDEASYGDYFQWGRWDDGHQVPNSPVITGGPSLLNPSNIPSGNPNFIVGQTAGTRWWGTGGLATDTWSGTMAMSTSGKDPCVALGAGWRLPSAADWENVKRYEDLEGSMTAFTSNLKLPAGGFRDAYGGFVFRGGETYYWSATASGSYATGLFISDNTYAATLQSSDRGQGFSCRCVKD